MKNHWIMVFADCEKVQIVLHSNYIVYHSYIVDIWSYMTYWYSIENYM